jgi:hypothetical protein
MGLNFLAQNLSILLEKFLNGLGKFPNVLGKLPDGLEKFPNVFGKLPDVSE